MLNAGSIHTPHVNVDSAAGVAITSAVNASVTTLAGSTVAVSVICAGTAAIGSVSVSVICAGSAAIGTVGVTSMVNAAVSLLAGTNTNEVVGDVAQDIAVAGNPVLVGARGSTAAPTDMSADGDSVYLWSTLKGALNVADAGGALTVDGTVTATVSNATIASGSIAVSVICAGTAAIGSVTVSVICAGAAAIGTVGVTSVVNANVTTLAGSTVAVSVICAGTAAIGSVSVSVVCAGSALIGFVTATPAATGGWSKKWCGAQGTTITQVTGNACTFGGYFCHNPNNATASYIQIFDTFRTHYFC